VLAGLLLAGCGGSGSTSSTATKAASTSTSTPASTSTTTSTSTGTTTTPKPAPGSKRTSPPAPTGARIPATYTIGSAGTLSPPTISAPSGFTVAVTLTNRDSKAHTVIIGTPKPSAAIHIPIGARSYLLEPRLPKGSYAITVDGAVHGALVIGSAPGP
jgi:hypothetical protein